MINVQYDKNGEIIIQVNKDGALNLITYLSNLLESKDTHYHLMTPSWGGNELSEELILPNSLLVNQVRLQLVE